MRSKVRSSSLSPPRWRPASARPRCPTRASRRSTFRSSPAPTMCSTPRLRTARWRRARPTRLNGWFQGLGLGYGDSVYVDGGYADAARGQVAAIAGRYGMMVSAGAPVTAGAVQPGIGPRRRQPPPRRGSRLPQLERAVAARLDNRTMSELRLRGQLEPRRDGRQPGRPDPRPRRRGVDDAVHRRQGGRSVPLDAADRREGSRRTSAPKGGK